jgi:dTDP-4-amino-4,6-dideoxygalactose transaminase
VSSSDPELAKLVVDHFKPDAAILAPGSSFSALPGSAKKYQVRIGSCAESFKASNDGGGYNADQPPAATEAPWPEFVPIWHEWRTSRVSLVELKDNPTEVGAVEVAVNFAETGLSLRQKHLEATARVLTAFVGGNSSIEPAAEVSTDTTVPPMISLDWDLQAVDRFIRAHQLPPAEPAKVEDPKTGESYFIENMSQFSTFLSKVCGQGSPKNLDGQPKNYAADTHWYSNMGGTIVKIGDQIQHMPRRCSEGAFKMVIPGATLGGGPEKLRMNEPLIGPNAERYCASALAASWIGVEGPFVKKFEAQLANICGCAAACCVQSGTAALYGAMKALGVSDSTHHVLTPAFTCAAAADAVVHAGGTPISTDCETETYGISTEAVRAALERDPNVVGVVAAHCYGVPIRDIYEIQELCKQKGIWLCEDACESYGAGVHLPPGVDKSSPPLPIASIGTLNVISTRSEKMIGVGEGGAIVGNDTTLVARAKWWCSRAPCRGGGLWRVYEHEGVGQNFRLPEMLACVGCAAAEMFPTMIERKRTIHDWYLKNFASIPGLKDVTMQVAAPGDTPVWWVNACIMPEGVSGEEVGMQLMKDYPDIEIRPGFFPIDQMKIFQHEKVVPCPNTDLLFRRLVCMPSSANLTEENIDRICTSLAASKKVVVERGSSQVVKGELAAKVGCC